eukprot:TRINITY_DN18038_c0_g1_i1.p2 TRINITY_DN18038_c0_g1~~TRINITY_DN18038_c0_g1_i1.p2  ORF type:complete len:103 (-),score=20.13 TRINITY_DN18038_c0_g1_i1:36-344(-)
MLIPPAPNPRLQLDRSGSLLRAALEHSSSNLVRNRSEGYSPSLLRTLSATKARLTAEHDNFAVLRPSARMQELQAISDTFRTSCQMDTPKGIQQAVRNVEVN